MIDKRVVISAQERRESLESELNIAMSHIASGSVTDADVSRNCENRIGVAQIPLGVAGPIEVHGEHAKGKFLLPLATTEGALVASINRGSKAITLSGGAQVLATRVGMTRGPVFFTKTLKKSSQLTLWVKDNKEKLQKIAQKTSSHIKLLDIQIKTLPDYVFLRFSFDTQDAMGMNMVTIATDAIVAEIEKATSIYCLALAGNFDIDKKPAWLNMIEGRGIKVLAEIILSNEVLNNVLKTSAQAMYDVWLGKCLIGSAMSGSLGFNAQFANVIAALFIATGQDAAHIVEGSLGITTMRVEKDNLYCSITLPSLAVGTVGGGTQLPTQKEALSIMGIVGQNDVLKFAEVIGAAVLAGEISLLASLSVGTLAKAHAKLGRKQK